MTNNNQSSNFRSDSQRETDSTSCSPWPSASHSSSHYFPRIPSNNTTIRVENLPYFFESRFLSEHFERYAVVKELLVGRDKETQKRVVMVSFESAVVAKAMVRMFHGQWFMGRKLM
jgi:RNA recognition motif-containing protein